MFIEPHSAIPSWYGYAYQGHAAINRTLMEIDEIINDYIKEKNLDKINDLSDVESLLLPYEFELEWMEDFSYKYNGEYYEFHQVKASDENQSIEKDALFDIIFKINFYGHYINKIGIKEKTTGVFHLADESINLPSSETIEKSLDDLASKLKTELQEILELSLEEKVKNLKSTKGRTKHSIRKAIYSDSNKPFDKIENCNELILNKYLEGFKEKIDNMRLKQTEIEQLIIKISKPCFSSIDKIEINIAKTICSITNKIAIYEGVVDETMAKEVIIPQIVIFITKYIDKRKKETIRNEIGFNELLSEIIKSINYKHSVLYNMYKYRVDIAKGLSMFIEDECGQVINDCNECEDKEKCNLYCFWSQFITMHIDKALSLLRNVNFTNDLSKGLQEFPSESCLHDTLFSYIKELEEMKLHDTHVSIRKKNKNYWCTTYNQSYEAKKFIKQIERNKFNIIELLFEADVLISKNSPLPQIEFGKGKIIDITSEELQELSKHTGTNYSDFPTRIIEPKNIEILDFEAAKGELKC